MTFGITAFHIMCKYPVLNVKRMTYFSSLPRHFVLTSDSNFDEQNMLLLVHETFNALKMNV